MKHYRYILFDADDTLINFGKDERRAFRVAFGENADGAMLEELRRYEYAHWDELRLHEVHDPAIQKNFHALYYAHVRAVFDYAEERYGLGESRKEKEEAFFNALCLPAHLEEGALETVKELSSRYKIYVATNGLARMQRGRLKELTPYLSGIFVSEELGVIKPTEEFGRAVLSALRARAEDCLWVGDSLSSEIALALRMHMDCAWLNSARKPRPQNLPVTYELSSLKELTSLL